MLNQLDEFLNDWLAANELSAAVEVNSGMCEEFAIDLSERMPGSQVVYTEDFVDWDSDEHPGGHAWVALEGKHYDAECLEGVSDWKTLPFFVRRVQPESKPAVSASIKMG